MTKAAAEAALSKAVAEKAQHDIDVVVFLDYVRMHEAELHASSLTTKPDAFSTSNFVLFFGSLNSLYISQLIAITSPDPSNRGSASKIRSG